MKNYSFFELWLKFHFFFQNVRQLRFSIFNTSAKVNQTTFLLRQRRLQRIELRGRHVGFCILNFFVQSGNGFGERRDSRLQIYELFNSYFRTSSRVRKNYSFYSYFFRKFKKLCNFHKNSNKFGEFLSFLVFCNISLDFHVFFFDFLEFSRAF